MSETFFCWKNSLFSVEFFFSLGSEYFRTQSKTSRKIRGCYFFFFFLKIFRSNLTNKFSMTFKFSNFTFFGKFHNYFGDFLFWNIFRSNLTNKFSMTFKFSDFIFFWQLSNLLWGRVSSKISNHGFCGTLGSAFWIPFIDDLAGNIFR